MLSIFFHFVAFDTFDASLRALLIPHCYSAFVWLTVPFIASRRRSVPQLIID